MLKRVNVFYMDDVMLDSIISLHDTKLYYTHCISLNKISKKTKGFIISYEQIKEKWEWSTLYKGKTMYRLF